jgi:hypothetical protein
MYKVVVISDGVDFEISNFQLKFVQMKDIPSLFHFFKAEDLDVLFQKRDKSYMNFLNQFYKKFHDYDILICDQINPFHPEWLHLYFPNTTKIYGMIDDPVCTYHRTLSQLWAFNGVFYVSPGYNEMYTMDELIKAYNSNLSSHFLPHARNNVLTEDHVRTVSNSFKNRTGDVLYVGAYYESKVDRLIYLKNRFGTKFSVFGYWPYNGFRGIMRALEFKKPFFHRVKSISEYDKFNLFLNHKICFNMNWNEKRETGNMRMYQAPFYGMLLLCDKSAKDQHNIIFDTNEAVFYDGIEDAADKISFYLQNDKERIKIANNGFKRAIRDYNKDNVWTNLLNWANGIR